MPTKTPKIKLDPAQFPAVEYESPLLPFESPQRIPGNPHRLPPRSARIRFPPDTLIGSDIDEGGLLPPPPLLPAPPNDSAWIIDPHHYAQVAKGVQNPVSVAAIQTPFLLQPETRRNFLSIRNGSASGGANIYIDFGTSASALSPILLTPGQTVLFDTVVPQDDLYAFADAAAGIMIWGYGNIPGTAP